MQRILYDLTDVVIYAVHHSQVTGIQRVQIDVYRQLKKRADIEVIPVCFSPLARRFIEFDVDRVFGFDRKYSASLICTFKYRLQREAYRRWRRFRGYVRPKIGDTIYIGGAGWAAPRRSSYVFSLIEELKLDVVWMFYDLIPISRPEYVTEAATAEFKKWLDSAIAHRGRFLCISDYSRKQLIEYAASFGRPVEAVTTPLAHELAASSPRIRNDLLYLKREKFVLCVGSIEIRKNHLQLARIWNRLFEERGHEIPILVLVGRRGWYADRLWHYLGATSWVRGQIIHIEDASDAELMWLYQHCEFSIFPSLYEGWGLPIGESLWMGKNVICYDLTSHKEAGLEFATYCDPSDPKSLETAIRAMLDSGSYPPPPIRERLRTWQTVGDDVVEALAVGPAAGMN